MKYAIVAVAVTKVAASTNSSGFGSEDYATTTTNACNAQTKKSCGDFLLEKGNGQVFIIHQDDDASACKGELKKNLANKIFGYLARCDGKFCI